VFLRKAAIYSAGTTAFCHPSRPLAAIISMWRSRGVGVPAAETSLTTAVARGGMITVALGSPIGNGPVDRIAVIRAVRQDGGDRGRNLVKQRANQRGVALLGRGQGRSENLAGVRIDGQVQLAPGPPIAAAMLGHLPFTGAENLQAGAVDHHGDRTSRHGQ